MRREPIRLALLAVLMWVGCADSTQHTVSVKATPEQAQQPQYSARRAAVVRTLIGVQHGTALDERALNDELGQILETTPQDAFILANLGTLSFRAGKMDEGLSYYEQWYAESSDVSAGLALANELLRAGDYKRAKTIYQTLVDAGSEALGPLTGLGRILFEMGALDEAWKIGVRLARLHPEAEAGHAILAGVSLARGETGVAGLLIRRAKLAKASGPALALARGRWLEARGDLGAALVAYREGAATYTGEGSLRLELGRVSLLLEDYRGALRVFEELLKEDPSDTQAVLGAALACRGIGLFERADTLYLQLMSADSPEPRALWNRAILLHHHMAKPAAALALYDILDGILPKPLPSIYAGLPAARADARQKAAAKEAEAKR